MNINQIQSFVNQTIEIEELKEKLKKWEACADMLFVWADEVRCGTTNQALYEAVKGDIIKYNRLKLNEPDA